LGSGRTVAQQAIEGRKVFDTIDEGEDIRSLAPPPRSELSSAAGSGRRGSRARSEALGCVDLRQFKTRVLLKNCFLELAQFATGSDTQLVTESVIQPLERA
jgi:hypothetical protein